MRHVRRLTFLSFILQVVLITTLLNLKIVLFTNSGDSYQPTSQDSPFNVACRFYGIKWNPATAMSCNGEKVFTFWIGHVSQLLSCQTRVTVTSCFAYNIIRDLLLINCLCINPSDLSISVRSSGVYKLFFT